MLTTYDLDEYVYDALEAGASGFLLKDVATILAKVDLLDAAIAELSEEIERVIAPFDREVALLDTIPGVNQRAAESLVAEIGADVGRFTTASHLASWAGMCPGNNESAGKRRSGKTRKGSKWLGAILAESAAANGRSNDTYLGAQHRRLTGRIGYVKANKAVGHSILVAAWHVLSNGDPYEDIGADWSTARWRTQDRHRRRHRPAQSSRRNLRRSTDRGPVTCDSIE